LTGGNGNDVFLDTIANFSGDTITDFARGDRIVLTDANLGLAVALAVGSSGSQLTFGSTSLFLSNVSNPSIAIGAAPEGGVQIFFGGPPIIVSSAIVPAGATFAEAPSATKLVTSAEIPGGFAEHAFLFDAPQFPDLLVRQPADGIFVMS
jgi:hypothetical protein